MPSTISETLIFQLVFPYGALSAPFEPLIVIFFIPIFFPFLCMRAGRLGRFGTIPQTAGDRGAVDVLEHGFLRKQREIPAPDEHAKYMYER